ncbi:MAG: amidohydrolase family protein, partial [Gammaproteobacteria bacterium]|nr:amidohydrolase family protein [Gammaproteobacteria bacterium]
MRRTIFSLVLLGALTACGSDEPTASAPPASGNLAVTCGRVIDGLSDDVVAKQLIIIRNGRIDDIRDAGGEPPPGLSVLDLPDHTCLPGLIDTHVHLASRFEDSGDMAAIYTRPVAESTRIAEKNAIATLQAGFTTVRNVGDYFPSVVHDMKLRELNGQVRSPRIQDAGPYMTIPAGGGDLVIPGEDESRIPAEVRLGVARGPEEFARKTEAALDAGADVIKVIASGAVFAFGGVPGAPEMTPEEIEAVVDAAHARGVKVTAHAHGAQSIKDAINAGVDSIEHASLADNEAIALAAEHGVAFSMDVYNGTYTAEVGEELGYPEEFMRKNEET